MRQEEMEAGTRLRPVCHVLEKRRNPYESFHRVAVVPEDRVTTIQDQVEKLNAQAGYRQWRVLTR